MKRKIHWKTLTAVTAALGLFAAGALFGHMTKPHSVIHVVTVKWADDASEEQIAKALEGVRAAHDGDYRHCNRWLDHDIAQIEADLAWFRQLREELSVD